MAPRTEPNLALLAVSVFLALGCQPAAVPAVRDSNGASPPRLEAPSRTLTLGVRYEIGSLAAKVSAGITSSATKRLFNAALTMVDGAGTPLPYLAEVLPQVNTPSWRVFPDGRMETTYRLRPGLTWHDGTPLSVEDFVFAWRVYSNPGFGVFETGPQDRMESVTAPDAQTLVIQWREIYPDAGTLREADLEPLPRHLLEAAFSEDAPEIFVNRAYWSREFVGVGPYRLENWEPGSSIASTAFHGHALGRPKIDRIVVRFIPDENTMLTALLAGAVDIAMDNSLRFEHAAVLRGEWGPTNKGVVLVDPVQPHLTNIQFRPEYANPRALLDLRFRRALAHSVDKQAVTDGLFAGEVSASDQFLPRTIPYFAELDRAIVKYPYDLRLTEQFMVELGYRKGADGGYAANSGERVHVEHWVIAGSQNEKQSSIMADGWRRAGFGVVEYAIPAAQSTNGEARATFPSLSGVATGGGERNLNFLATSQIPTPGNRWRGNNRGGWSNPAYDELWQAFNTTLDRPARTQQVIQMMRLATEEVAMLFLFHSPNVTAHYSALRGPETGAPDTLTNWNIHEWELR